MGFFLSSHAHFLVFMFLLAKLNCLKEEEL